MYKYLISTLLVSSVLLAGCNVITTPNGNNGNTVDTSKLSHTYTGSDFSIQYPLDWVIEGDILHPNGAEKPSLQLTPVVTDFGLIGYEQEREVKVENRDGDNINLTHFEADFQTFSEEDLDLQKGDVLITISADAIFEGVLFYSYNSKVNPDAARRLESIVKTISKVEGTDSPDSDPSSSSDFRSDLGKYTFYFSSAYEFQKSTANALDTHLEAFSIIKPENIITLADGQVGDPVESRISVTLHDNADDMDLGAWAEANMTQTNYDTEMILNLEDLMLSGYEAISYSWVGLGGADEYLIKLDGMVLQIRANYVEEDDSVRADLATFIQLLTIDSLVR